MHLNTFIFLHLLFEQHIQAINLACLATEAHMVRVYVTRTCISYMATKNVCKNLCVVSIKQTTKRCLMLPPLPS